MVHLETQDAQTDGAKPLLAGNRNPVWIPIALASSGESI